MISASPACLPLSRAELYYAADTCAQHAILGRCGGHFRLSGLFDGLEACQCAYRIKE